MWKKCSKSLQVKKTSKNDYRLSCLTFKLAEILKIENLKKKRGTFVFPLTRSGSGFRSPSIALDLLGIPICTENHQEKAGSWCHVGTTP